MTTDQIRRLLLAVLVLGILGTSAELILLAHYETWQQWLPLALLALGFVVAGGVATRGGRGTLVTLRLLSLVFVLAGGLGIYFHVTANMEFEREMDASIGGTALARESLTGALPALAPGAMVLLGLIGLTITAGHPAIAKKQE